MNLNNVKSFLDLVDSQRGKLKEIVYNSKSIIILGNGGSNAIASHIAEDYTKVLNKRAISFSDGARLTCYINDYGHENAYVEFVRDFADVDTLVILISSSGKSKNIVNAAKLCDDNKLKFITLSGFDVDNPLNSFRGSLLNFYIPSMNYGEVECVHQIFLHSII